MAFLCTATAKVTAMNLSLVPFFLNATPETI